MAISATTTAAGEPRHLQKDQTWELGLMLPTRRVLYGGVVR
jgi:hypothetical protein